MAQNLAILIVDKTGTLKTTTVKEYKEEELYKKCGFKKAEGFAKQTEWAIKLEGKKYLVSLFAKKDGKANTENKYDFPPPVDKDLYFGSCALVGRVPTDVGNDATYYSLTIEIWEKMYEKLFGGFENLDLTCAEDEEEEDELANIPIEKKTKQGYLKDGFVVDSDDEEASEYDSLEDSEDEEEEEGSNSQGEEASGLEIEDIGSELSSEDYEYSDEDTEKA